MNRILAARIFQDGRLYTDQSRDAQSLIGEKKSLDELAQDGWKLITVSVLADSNVNYVSTYAYLQKEDL